MMFVNIHAESFLVTVTLCFVNSATCTPVVIRKLTQTSSPQQVMPCLIMIFPDVGTYKGVFVAYFKNVVFAGVSDVEGLNRVLRCAISFGYFGEVHKSGQPVRYCNNRLSAVLREKHVQCQKDFVRPHVWLTVTEL